MIASSDTNTDARPLGLAVHLDKVGVLERNGDVTTASTGANCCQLRGQASLHAHARFTVCNPLGALGSLFGFVISTEAVWDTASA